MRNFVFCALVCMLVHAAVGDDDIQLEDEVLVLKTTNFQKAITDNKFVLVEFYAPWCGHCKALAPEYAKAAKTLKDEGSEIKLGKVDATEETSLAEENKVKGYPTLKFYRDGKAAEYNGGRTAQEIVDWLKKKTGPAAKDLKTVAEAKEFTDAAEVAIVGFFKDQESDAAKQYLSTAASIDDYPFAITSADEVFSEHSVSGDKVVLFKKFDEGKAEHDGEIKEDEITKFIKANALPLVTEFTPESAQKIFGGDIKSHLLAFVTKKSAEFEGQLDALKTVAPEFRKDVLFVYIDIEDEDHGRILDFFGMKKEEAPALRLIKLEDEMSKYKPADAGITADNVRKFVSDFIAGKLKVHLLSQDLPEDWDSTGVKTLVATNFDEVVMNTDKDVLVEFYAPWCGHCKQLAPIYDKLGEKYKDSDSVVIAKIDATANELEHTKIHSFPTLKMWKKGDNKVIEYNGERTLEGMGRFIDSGGEFGVGGPEVVDYDGPRTLEGMEAFLEGKPIPKEGKAEEAEEEEGEEEEEEEDEGEGSVEKAEEEDEDDDAPRKDEL